MTFDIGLTLAVLAAAVVLFATEKLSVDLVGITIMAALLAAGVVTAEDGIAGFSNPATVTVAGMFVLSAGLYKTGAVNVVGVFMARLARRNIHLAFVVLMVGLGTISAFINNTAAVAVFMPIVLGVARDTRTSPSKWLMPISFASMFGGVCTLVGTSTNILVSTSAEQHGQPPFRMFEFTPLGAVMFVAGIAYMLLIGRHLIPPRRDVGDLMQSFGMGDYLTEVELLPEAKSVGKPLRQSSFGKDLDLAVLEVRRSGQPALLPTAETILEANDQLLVRCSVEKIRALQESSGVRLKPSSQWRDADLESDDLVLVETVIAPGASLHGRTLKETRFRNTFGAVVLAIRHHGKLLYENLADTVLQSGDALLVEIQRTNVPDLRRSNEFVLVSAVGLPEFHKDKLLPALTIMAGVVTAATVGIFPIVVSAIIGCVLMVFTGCLTLKESYNAINWQVIFLLAGVLTLGRAMESTGAAMLLSSWIVETVGSWGPLALLSAFYLLSSALTQIVSNNATAVLLTPIAIAAATGVGADPRPFLMAVTFAASAAFMTPVGYQTNTLIYGPGQYRFTDFVRVGLPLTILLWLLATWLIPHWWPF